MRFEVMTYKNIADQKSRLVARLMLLHTLKEAGKEEYVFAWQKDSNKKPFIRQWDFFNISHAGDMVVLVYAKQPVGIDIEKEIQLNYTEVMRNFHPQEQQCIIMSTNPLNAFYRLWVKKEALLKALGIGLVNNLEQYNCIGEAIAIKEHMWHFHELQLVPGYSCSLCSTVKQREITIKSFSPEKMIITECS
jgi:4'-phosphopantetheinyl transferase